MGLQHFQHGLNEESDFYFTRTPELALSAATPNFSLQLTAGVEGRRYYDNPDISSWNYSEYFRLSSTDRMETLRSFHRYS